MIIRKNVTSEKQNVSDGNGSVSYTHLSKTSSKKGWRGRDGQVTFLSKTTVNKIINIMKMLIQKEIANDVKEAKLFSVLMDTTTGVSGFDQCVIVLRNMFETEVKERIIGLKCVQSSICLLYTSRCV